MTKSKSKIREIVKRLRSELGLSQTAFGLKLGLSLSTIMRYERITPPTGKALAALAKLANRHGHHWYAQAFITVLADELELPQIADVYKTSGT